MSDNEKAVVWFRNDLRLDDHHALSEACRDFKKVLLVYIHPQESRPWSRGSASSWWLHHALVSLMEELKKKSASLLIFKGDEIKIFRALVKNEKISALYFNRRIEPSEIDLEDRLLKALDKDLLIKRFDGNLLFDVSQIKTGQGKPYQVYTPFWKACVQAGPPPKPKPTPGNIPSEELQTKSSELKPLTPEQLQLLPKVPWDEDFYAYWDASIEGARRQYQKLKTKMDSYDKNRDLPHLDGTSRLSPYLHFGQISPCRIWHAIENGRVPRQSGRLHFMKELVWREFAQYLLFHFPHLPEEPLREDYEKFPWRQSDEDLQRWQMGQTGYPLVDAGMRQLWKTGWMHNRVRMVVASFLVKHLLISWKEGAAWFWDCLVDADLGSNTLGWQWAGGCGPDAAPYFRIFNPILQSEKFDAEGNYIRQWVPELSKLNKKQIHEPWKLSPLELRSAGIQLGKDYPLPLVEHRSARERALKAYEKIRKAS